MWSILDKIINLFLDVLNVLLQCLNFFSHCHSVFSFQFWIGGYLAKLLYTFNNKIMVGIKW